ncbi:MAG TPA: glycosyltransferase family 39 protein [Bryobacteraceae bacterium]|nr:glycosyltransferase family 39 protein [Bryobacteraceae bacterium]
MRENDAITLEYAGPTSPGAAWRKRGLRCVAIAALAVFAFYGDARSINADEVWSLRTVALSPGAMIQALQRDVHPPLYFLLLWAWVRMFGFTEIAARTLSGIFFAASAASLYAMVRSFWDRRTAVLAAAIYVFSPLALLAAHFARMYALVSLLAVISTWAYLRLWREPSLRLTFILAGATALGTLTHIWFFFLALAEGVCALPQAGRARRAWTALGAGLLPFAVLWSPALIGQLRQSSETLAWLPRPGVAMLGRTLFLYCGALALFLPAVARAYWKRRAAPPREGLVPVRIVVSMLLITIGAPLVLSFWRPVFWSRFTIVALHLFAIVAAHAGARAIRGNQLAALLAMVSLPSFLYVFHADSKCDARPGAGYIARSARAGDWVVYSSLSRAPMDYYLRSQAELKETSFPAEIDRHPGYEGPLESTARLTALRREAEGLVNRIAASPGQRVYFLHGFRPSVDAILLRGLEARFVKIQSACVECEEMGSYYNRISVFDVTESRSLSRSDSAAGPPLAARR